MASNDVATSDDKENAGKSIDDTNGLQCIRIIQNLRGCKRKIPIRQLTTELTSCNPTGVGAEITYIFTEKKSLIVQFATQDSVRLLLSNSDLLSNYGLAVEKMAPKILAGGREDKHSLLMMGLPRTWLKYCEKGTKSNRRIPQRKANYRVGQCHLGFSYQHGGN
ncbi:uncharacterized protein [Ptychodera flava]|uniref:uncharacterized protein n=1 Tax=Ptychodera flava TaxID=63121 RepID=UPI00396A85C7